MPEAVIVSTARSPIGRAHKGSLTQVRPDDLAATIIRAALDKVPSLDPTLVEDIMLGCAQPAGAQGQVSKGHQVPRRLRAREGSQARNLLCARIPYVPR